jgi:hypothetical protein
MLIESLPIFAELSSVQVFTLWIVALGVAFLTVVSLAGIIVPAWVGIHKARLETALKQQMLERGMSAEEIVRVLNAPQKDRGGAPWDWASSAGATHWCANKSKPAFVDAEL